MKKEFLRDRHSLWTNHNLELLLWSLVLFLVLTMADNLTKHAFGRPQYFSSGAKVHHHALGEIAQSPELGN